MNQHSALSVSEVSVLRTLAHQETERTKDQRNARKVEIAREMEATWAAEREIDQRLEPRLAQLDDQLKALDAQKVAVFQQVEATRLESQRAKAPHSDRRTQLRREQLAINDTEIAEQAASEVHR